MYVFIEHGIITETGDSSFPTNDGGVSGAEADSTTVT
jgi:hypothetical protein